jgi:uncharacterized protein YkwD
VSHPSSRRLATSRRALAALLLLPLALLAAADPSPTTASEPGDDPTSRVVRLVNVERAARDLPALAVDAALRDDAQTYAESMASTGWFSHQSRDGSTITDRAEAAGYARWRFLGENLARGHQTAERAVAAWLASPSHRANLLTTEADEIGVGYARPVGGERPYWVAVVGSRG